MRFTIGIAVLLLLAAAGAVQAKEKELTCRFFDGATGQTKEVDSAQLTINEDAGTVFWHWQGMTEPVPAVFTSDSIKWVIRQEDHYELNRNTGLLTARHWPSRICSASQPKI